MTCRYTILISLLTLGLGLAGCEKSETNELATASEETILCPVMPDKKIDRAFFVDYQGSRVYLCCNTCVKVFKKRPERYMKKAQELGIVMEKVPSDVTQ